MVNPMIKIGLLLSLGVSLLATQPAKAASTQLISGVIMKNQSIVPSYLLPQANNSETVLSLLQEHHKVIRGFVCTSPNDIRCIDGLCNKEGIAYWEIKVNGDFKHYNSMSHVKQGDEVEVRYQRAQDFGD